MNKHLQKNDEKVGYGTPVTHILLLAQSIITKAKAVGWVEDFTQFGVTRLTRGRTTLIVSIFDSMVIVIYHGDSHKQARTVDLNSRDVGEKFIRYDPEMKSL